MADEIKYTTRAEGSTRSRARADTDDVLLIVPPAVVVAASPEARQRLSVGSGLPWPTVLQIAERGQPVVVGNARTPAQASEQAERLKREGGLAAEVVVPGAPVALGSTLVAGASAALLAGLAVITGLLGYDPLIMWVLVGILAAVTGWQYLSWSRRRASWDVAWRAWQEARESTQRSAATWRALLDLRAESLDGRLPLEAQVDLWRSIEAVEVELLAGKLDDASAQAALAQARAPSATPEGADTSAALQALQRTARAASRAVEGA